MNMFLPWVVGMISQVYTQVKTHGIVYIKYVKVFVYQLYWNTPEKKEKRRMEEGRESVLPLPKKGKCEQK